MSQVYDLFSKGWFLTRDPRVVERKKYGKAKARRKFPKGFRFKLNLKKLRAFFLFKKKMGFSVPGFWGPLGFCFWLNF
ncbi:MAG: hypothetical protein CM15mP62_23300 [Rhodospirillaceae bacterium]|nr:MAG: hypothetical protein CM15mP62_23300 [Rhodospirillaceae bacterium]